MSKLRLFLGAIQLPIQGAGIAIGALTHNLPAIVFSAIFALWGAYIVADEVHQ